MADIAPAASRRDGSLAFALVLVVLAASIPSFMTIPFFQPWPLDFQNVWAFHHCAAMNDPYAASGAACGDAIARDMLYPPLLYWFFAWTRPLTFRTASMVWTALVALGTASATLAWTRERSSPGPGSDRTSIFAALLLAQFPLMFALERGNNDVVVLVLWTLAAIAYRRGHRAVSGAIAGLAAVLKLYPVFAIAVVAAGMIGTAVRRPTERRGALAFASAGIVAAGLGIVVVYSQSVTYATTVLPNLSGTFTGLTTYGHPLHTLWPLWDGKVLSLPILLAWCVGSVLVFDRDPIAVFAGALAISTYFAGMTWDYNLITTYPLLVVLFMRAMRGSPAAYTGLLVGLVAIVGHRAIFATTETAMRIHVALQWTFLFGAGAAAPWFATRELSDVERRAYAPLTSSTSVSG